MTIDVSLNRRLDKVVRKHDRMRANGVVHRVGRDGLIRSRPRLFRLHFPVKGLLVIAGLFIAFKAVLFAQMGPATYGSKIEELRAGSAIEQVGAVVMQRDPITVAISGVIKPYLFQ